MNAISLTAFDLAQRFLGEREGVGTIANVQILAMLRLDDDSIADDETPWCSAFVNYVAWLLRLPRSKSLAARSWLGVGAPVGWADALLGFDVVVLSRPPSPASGHVGFFAGWDESEKSVRLLGGNQGNAVSIAVFPVERILGIRRLRHPA